MFIETYLVAYFVVCAAISIFAKMNAYGRFSLIWSALSYSIIFTFVDGGQDPLILIGMIVSVLTLAVPTRIYFHTAAAAFFIILTAVVNMWFEGRFPVFLSVSVVSGAALFTAIAFTVGVSGANKSYKALAELSRV